MIYVLDATGRTVIDWNASAERLRRPKGLTQRRQERQRFGPVYDAVIATREFEALLIGLHEPARLQQFAPEAAAFFSAQLDKIIADIEAVKSLLN
jgi:hypothetical protein